MPTPTHNFIEREIEKFDKHYLIDGCVCSGYPCVLHGLYDHKSFLRTSLTDFAKHLIEEIEKEHTESDILGSGVWNGAIKEATDIIKNEIK